MLDASLNFENKYSSESSEPALCLDLNFDNCDIGIISPVFYNNWHLEAFKTIYNRHIKALPKYDASLTKIMAGAIPYFDRLHSPPPRLNVDAFFICLDGNTHGGCHW